MHDLADVAQRLRTVRDAHRRFLALYAVEVALVEPGLDRVVDDLTIKTEDETVDDDNETGGFLDAPDFPDWLPGADAGDGPASLGW
jgi:hypothetical protein